LKKTFSLMKVCRIEAAAVIDVAQGTIPVCRVPPCGVEGFRIVKDNRTEQRLAETDRVFREIKARETEAKQAKTARLRLQREQASKLRSDKPG
jgi:predicted transcriptional regulator